MASPKLLLLLSGAMFAALLLLLVSCSAQDKDAYYVCFGGLKVKNISECDFSKLNFSLDACDTRLVYESGAAVSNANEVVMAFRDFKKEADKNITFVSASYYGMHKGIDYYRMNFYDSSDQAKKQYFVDSYGRIYKPANCRD